MTRCKVELYDDINNVDLHARRISKNAMLQPENDGEVVDGINVDG